MFSARRHLPIVALALLAVSPWLPREDRSATRTGNHALSPSTCYAIATAGERAAVDLRGGRYVLIVSSLGDASRSYTVRLTSEPVEEASLVPAQALGPFTPADPPPLPGPVTGNQEGGAAAAAPPGGAREFHLHVTEGALDDPQQYTRIPAELVGEGENVRVYLDAQVRPDQLDRGLTEEIIESFEQAVLPTSRRLLGDYRDVDGDGRFSILISPWLDRLQGGRTSLGGMARASDFRPDLNAPLSNRADVLYLNANLRPNDHLRTLLAHEFAHALCFSRRIAASTGETGLPTEEDWLTEAIAHLSEDIHGFGWSNLDHRVAQFLDEPQTAPLVVSDYYRAGLWRDAGCRGATYLFLRWCVDQFGEGLLMRLAAAPGRGTANLEIATGVPFAELYRRWTVALLLSGRNARAGRASEFDEYCALDLLGRLGEWQLAGPRLTCWKPCGEPCDLALRGTSTAFVMLDGCTVGKPLRVRIQAEPGTRLQASIVRLEESAPELQAEARMLARSPESHGAAKIRLRAVGRSESPLRIQAVSCEWQTAGQRRSLPLDSEIVRRMARSGERRTAFEAEFDLPMPAKPRGEERAIIKLIAVDARGRRAAARAEIRPEPSLLARQAGEIPARN